MFSKRRVNVFQTFSYITLIFICIIKRAAMCENVSSEMCALQAFKSVCTSAQSDKSLLPACRNFASLAIQKALSEAFDQTCEGAGILNLY